MGELHLPPRGLTFLHDTHASNDAVAKHSKETILLNLTEDITNDVLKSIKNNEQVRLKTGRKPLIQYGKKSIQLNAVADAFPTDVFEGPINGSKPLYFSGRLSLSLEVLRAKEDTVKSDEALAALQSTLKSIQEQKESNEASLVGGGKKQHGRSDSRSSTLMKERFLGSAPSSPYLSAGLSPRLAPTSMPFVASLSAKEKIRLDAMRIPAVHLLAVRPMSTGTLAQELNMTSEECEKVMEKISSDAGGKKELNRKIYRELDVWKFPYKFQEDRQLAIEHAIQAFDRLRIEKHDNLWQMLLPKENRGKGVFLSKLNFDKQIAPPKPVSVDKDVKVDYSDKEGKVKQIKNSSSKESLTKKKQQAMDDSIVRPKAVRPVPKSAARPAKQDLKMKSAERIEDSDEEAESAPVIPAKEKIKTGSTRPKLHPEERPLTTLSHDKSHPQKPKSAGARTTSAVAATSGATKNKPKGVEPNAIKTSPRSLTGNSTQKRSPLGSSPPTNSTDLENSSKSSVQSSAPSSPPSSTDAALINRHNSAASISTRTSDTQKKVVKRKADVSALQPAAKRQQINGDRLNALPRGLSHHLEQSTPERRLSGSSMSSPEKIDVSKKTVVTAAKRFTKYYGQYRVLHERLSHLSSKERTDKDIDDLWRMHKRLEEMKVEIWSDWDKVGGDT